MIRLTAVALVSLVAFAPTAPVRAVAHVNGTTGNWTSGTSITATLNGVGSGDTLVALVHTTGAAITATVEDGTNTYTSRCGRTFLAGAGGITMYVVDSATAGNYTITATLSGTPADGAMTVEEYSGSTGFDAAANGAAGSTGTSASPATSITTGVANAMVVGGFGYAGAGGAFTNGSGYTTRGNPTPGIRSAIEDQLVTTATSYTIDATIASSTTWTACGVSLASGGGGAASFVPAIINNVIRGGGFFQWFYGRLP